MTNDIVRVWGSADSFTLEYAPGGDGRWYASIPPDLEDGQYAAEILAQNLCGEIGSWTGVLYMHKGRAELRLRPQRYTLWFQPPCFAVHLEPPRIKLILKER